MRPTVSMRKALGDPKVLGNAFEGDSWKPWRTLLIAAMGEKLTDDERTLFKTLTGREHEPLQRVDELAAVVGRRGGKSRAGKERRLGLSRELRPRRSDLILDRARTPKWSSDEYQNGVGGFQPHAIVRCRLQGARAKDPADWPLWRNLAAAS